MMPSALRPGLLVMATPSWPAGHVDSEANDPCNRDAGRRIGKEGLPHEPDEPMRMDADALLLRRTRAGCAKLWRASRGLSTHVGSAPHEPDTSSFEGVLTLIGVKKVAGACPSS